MTKPTSRIENIYKKQGYPCIAGIDEVGIGAWAGPVVSAAVILPDKARLPGLNDSKLVKASLREELYDYIVDQAISWGVGIEDGALIDEVGLAEVQRRSMREAISKLDKRPDLLLVDGRGIKQLGIKAECIIKGDRKVRCIAAASILAKVTRDRIMRELHKEFPDYGFDEHKGYGTKRHQEAIAKYGIAKPHRLSYVPIFYQWQGDLF